MQKFVLSILVITFAIILWLILGRLGFWDSTGHHAKKQAKKTFLKHKEFEEDGEDD